MIKKMQSNRTSTSWQGVQGWYKKTVGLQGSYYQRAVIIPNTLELLALGPSSSLLDLACGQGVLGRAMDPNIDYYGVDSAPSLIDFSKENDRARNHRYQVADICQKLAIEKHDFTHATLLLAAQNIEDLPSAFRNANQHLAPGGKFVMVLNHPCFRIPKHSSWEIDDEHKIQYRRLDCYMSSLKVPIQTNPSKNRSSTLTWSYHYPLSYFTECLFKSGFHISKIEEWISNKKSEGKKAAMENRSRKEFPLFLALVAMK